MREFARAIKDLEHVQRAWDNDLDTALQLAVLRLADGDVSGYRNDCNRILRSLAKRTPDPALASRLAWVSCLSSEEIDHWHEIVNLAQIAEKRSPGSETLSAIGAARYRDADFVQAIRDLEKANAAATMERSRIRVPVKQGLDVSQMQRDYYAPGPSTPQELEEPQSVCRDLFLALAYRARGGSDDRQRAEAYLKKAVQARRAWEEQFYSAANEEFVQARWDRFLEILILQTEAERVFSEASLGFEGARESRAPVGRP
jgi:hypothetical protein